MTSLVNKPADWPPNYHRILIFPPPESLKRLRGARKDELTDPNEPAIKGIVMWGVFRRFFCSSANLLAPPSQFLSLQSFNVFKEIISGYGFKSLMLTS